MGKKKITICLVCVVASLAMCVSVSAEEIKGVGAKELGAAMKAFNLRMAGKVDQAKEFLEKALAENPKDAAAHYELARIGWYLELGWTKGEAVDIRGLIDKAVKLDPNNVIYTYFAGCVAIGETYRSLRTREGAEKGKENLVRAIGTFESALKLKPDYDQAMLQLVDLNIGPESYGCDESKVEQYTEQLAEMGDVLGAKARSLYIIQNQGVTDRIDHWQEVLKEHEGNADVLEELGRVYLMADRVDDAVAYFEKAIEIDPERASLFLDLSVYHTIHARNVMITKRDKKLCQESITLGDAAVTRYIESEPIRPMLAYAIEVRAKYKSLSGDGVQKDVLFKQVEALAQHFSKATGSPHPILFIPPGEIYDGRPRYFGQPF